MLKTTSDLLGANVHDTDDVLSGAVIEHHGRTMIGITKYVSDRTFPLIDNTTLGDQIANIVHFGHFAVHLSDEAAVRRKLGDICWDQFEHLRQMQRIRR